MLGGSDLAEPRFPCLIAVLVQVGLYFPCFSVSHFTTIGSVVCVLLKGPLKLECCLGCEERLTSCIGLIVVCRVVIGSSVGMGWD